MVTKDNARVVCMCVCERECVCACEKHCLVVCVCVVVHWGLCVSAFGMLMMSQTTAENTVVHKHN